MTHTPLSWTVLRQPRVIGLEDICNLRELL